MNHRILILDDEESLRKAVTRALSKIAPVDDVDHPVAALALVQADSAKYGFILTDLKIPNSAGGLGFLEAIQPLYAGNPMAPHCWLYTGTPEQGLEAEVKRFGGEGVLVKPVDVRKLIQLANESFARYRQ